MSIPLYPVGGLRFWSGQEISLRDHAIATIAETVVIGLTAINPGWRFERCEGPTLTPRNELSPAYDGDDIWLLQAPLGEDEAAMRPETTPSSYAYARHLLKAGKHRMPLCVWQAGKSYRRETSDGASPSKLRFNEFWQQEFQSIYSVGTKADYRAAVLPSLRDTLGWLARGESRIVDSDRLPAYSESTMDVEVFCADRERWFEVASVSIRKDFAEDARVLEVAVGLDRIVELHGWNRG